MRDIGCAIYAGMLLLGSLALAADKPVDLSGTWVLDETEQSFSPVAAGPEQRGGGYPGVGMPGGGSYPGRGGGGYPGGGGPAPGATIPVEAGELTLAITQTPSEMQVERRWRIAGKEQSTVQTFALDGSKNRNPDDIGRGELNTKARWHKSSLVVEGTQHLSTGNREIEMPVKQEFSLSRDRSSLTVKTTRLTPVGLMSTKQVFRKS